MRRSFFALPLIAAAVLLFPAGLSAQKKPLDHSVYDSWESVGFMKLTPDGEIVAYSVSPQQGDSRLYLKNLRTGQELDIDRASRISIPLDASIAYCMVAAPYDSTRQAKIDKKKKDEMPKDSLAYVNLETFELVKVPDVSSVSAGYASAPYLFALSSSSPDSLAGRYLLVVDTGSGAVDTVRRVSSFEVSRSGNKLAVITEQDDKDSLSVSSVLLYDYALGSVDTLSLGCKAYSGLVFSADGDRLAFLSTEQEQKTDGTPACTLYLAEQKTLKKATRRSPAVVAVEVDTLVVPGCDAVPEGWVVASNSNPRFSNSSSRLVLNLRQYFPPKDTTLVSFETAGLDIWNWDAQVLPPMDKAHPVSFVLSAMIDLDDDRSLKVLSSNINDRINFVDGADAPFALSFDTDRYEFDNVFALESRQDISVVDLSDGSRRMLREGIEGSVVTSPSGKYLAWFNPADGQWYCIDTRTGVQVNLTASTGVAFYDEEDDHPAGFLPYGAPYWMGDDEYLLLEDRYDVWKFSPDGKTALNMTCGEGRKTGVDYTPERLTVVTDPYLFQNDRNFLLEGRIDLSAFCEADSRNGFAAMSAEKPSVPRGFLAENGFGSVVRASDAEVLAYTKGDFRHPRDLYVAYGDWEDEMQLSHINPQQADYLWGDVQLVSWQAYDSTPLKGLLYTPENLDPDAKYPMLIYFYEKNAETLYDYISPAPSRSIINIPYFVSNGYVVFVPDIVYEVGHPGESAFNCICSGAEAMCDRFPFIDRDRMGIQGQSWGGYQTAYLVTRTDMFAAAGAGAPVGNMTSAYGGIRWESGNSRITQYEYGQSRIGKSLWDEGGLDLYIENSPVFFAPDVTTPVLIMHNDADGAVPWYQGIEFFMSMRRLGKPAWLLEYNDEAHNLSERRNAKDLSVRLEQFFGHYLKGEPMPVWMKSGIPYARKGSYFGFEPAE